MCCENFYLIFSYTLPGQSLFINSVLGSEEVLDVIPSPDQHGEPEEDPTTLQILFTVFAVIALLSLLYPLNFKPCYKHTPKSFWRDPWRAGWGGGGSDKLWQKRAGLIVGRTPAAHSPHLLAMPWLFWMTIPCPCSCAYSNVTPTQLHPLQLQHCSAPLLLPYCWFSDCSGYSGRAHGGPEGRSSFYLISLLPPLSCTTFLITQIFVLQLWLILLIPLLAGLLPCQILEADG